MISPQSGINLYYLAIAKNKTILYAEREKKTIIYTRLFILRYFCNATTPCVVIFERQFFYFYHILSNCWSYTDLGRWNKLRRRKWETTHRPL